MDDVARLALSLEAVQECNNRMEAVAESKLLDFNLDKSSVILIWSKKFIRITKEKYKVNPIMLCNHKIKLSESESFLGDKIGSSLSISVSHNSKETGTYKETHQWIHHDIDCRSHMIGGITLGLDIWNLAIMPYLFYNSECWISTPKKATSVILFLSASTSSKIMSCYWLSVGHGNPHPREFQLRVIATRLLCDKAFFLGIKYLN